MEEELLKLAELNDEKKLREYLGNHEKSINWEKIDICEMKSVNSCEYYVLGCKYHFGLEIKNYQKAINYYELSAKLNNSLAQNNLGYMYQYGLACVEIDYQKALRYYELSAKQNNPYAQNNLGYMYQHGLGGVEIDYQKALYYYELSAKQNNLFAQNNLGYMYQYGIGVKKDIKKALYYFSLSARNDNSCAKDGLNIILRDKENYPDIIEYISQIFELEAKIKKLEMELDCIPEYGKGYFEVKKNFEDNKT